MSQGTARQLAVMKLMQRACQANGHQPLTLKHRSLAGTQTATGNNVRLRARSGNPTLETTTDSQVWATWVPVKVRGGSADGGDTAAGAQWVGRMFGQLSAVDVNGNVTTVIDNDWIVDPSGILYKIENPELSADGSYWTLSGVQQR